MDETTYYDPSWSSYRRAKAARRTRPELESMTMLTLPPR